MEPNTLVTVGMVVTCTAVATLAVTIYAYVSQVKNDLREFKIETRNERDLTRLEMKRLNSRSESNDEIIGLHLASHCGYIKQIEGFLEKKLEYGVRSKDKGVPRIEKN